jgi:hypothetical protein
VNLIQPLHVDGFSDLSVALTVALTVALSFKEASKPLPIALHQPRYIADV